MYKHGLIVGKFMPPTKGHQYLLEQARMVCEKVTVLVCSIKNQPISGYLRHYWLTQLFPDLNIVHVTDEVPLYPHEHPNFWNIWTSLVAKNTKDLDCVFTSESYGEEFAQKLGVKHILIDLERNTVPVSATLVRENPYKSWDYIPNIVKPYYIKRVVLTGPESTGKTTMAQFLSNRYATHWVHEYGRQYCDELLKAKAGAKILLKDISQIAAGQLYNEQIGCIIAGNVSKLAILDTDLIVTQIWSEIYFKSCPEWIVKHNTYNHHDLYLLMSPEIPWVADGQREFPDINMRKSHFDRIKKELDNKNLNYKIISGSDHTDREFQCITHVDELMRLTNM